MDVNALKAQQTSWNSETLKKEVLDRSKTYLELWAEERLRGASFDENVSPTDLRKRAIQKAAESLLPRETLDKMDEVHEQFLVQPSGAEELLHLWAADPLAIYDRQNP